MAINPSKIVVLLCAGCFLGAVTARTEQVTFHGALTQFAPDALGGIRSILRYDAARPDRRETAIIFLGGPARGGELPQEIQVLGQTDDRRHLADVEGADCTLERVAVLRDPAGVSVITATRVFKISAFRGGPSQADPAPMDIQVYRLEDGGDGGESELVLRAHDPPSQTGPICKSADVQRAIDVRAKVLSHSTGKTP